MEQKNTKKELTRILITVASILFGLYSFVLCPLYIYANTNIILYSTVLPEILNFAIRATDVLAYALCFSIMIYSVFSFTAKKSAGVYLSYVIALLLKYTANFIMTLVSHQIAFDFDELVLALLPFVFDCIILLAVMLSAEYFSSRHHDAVARGAAPSAFPIKSLVSFTNPLQKSALVLSLIMTLVNVVPRIRFDISYGAPESVSEFLLMCAYYLGDILSGVIIYSLSLIVFIKLDARYSQKDSINL